MVSILFIECYSENIRAILFLENLRPKQGIVAEQPINVFCNPSTVSLTDYQFSKKGGFLCTQLNWKKNNSHDITHQLKDSLSKVEDLVAGSCFNPLHPVMARISLHYF